MFVLILQHSLEASARVRHFVSSFHKNTRINLLVLVFLSLYENSVFI